MAWDRRIGVLVCAAAVSLLAACGGGASSITPMTGVGASSDAVAPVPPQGLEATAAPASRISQIEAQAQRDISASPSPTASPVDPIANWQLLEPLVISANATFSVAPWIRECQTLTALQGFWYIAWTNVSLPVSQFEVPACTLPSPSPSQWFTKTRPSIVALNQKLYVVAFEVSLFSITSTPIAQVSPNTTTGEYVMVPLQPTLSLHADSLYAFFLGDWLPAPPAVTESL